MTEDGTASPGRAPVPVRRTAPPHAPHAPGAAAAFRRVGIGGDDMRQVPLEHELRETPGLIPESAVMLMAVTCSRTPISAMRGAPRDGVSARMPLGMGDDGSDAFVKEGAQELIPLRRDSIVREFGQDVSAVPVDRKPSVSRHSRGHAGNMATSRRGGPQEPLVPAPVSGSAIRRVMKSSSVRPPRAHNGCATTFLMPSRAAMRTWPWIRRR